MTSSISSESTGIVSQWINLQYSGVHETVHTNKVRGTWLECSENERFVWNRENLTLYRASNQNTVEYCDRMSEIVTKGNLSFRIVNMDVGDLIKFESEMISLSTFIKSLNRLIIYDTTFEGWLIFNKSCNRELHRFQIYNRLYLFQARYITYGNRWDKLNLLECTGIVSGVTSDQTEWLEVLIDLNNFVTRMVMYSRTFIASCVLSLSQRRLIHYQKSV